MGIEVLYKQMIPGINITGSATYTDLVVYFKLCWLKQLNEACYKKTPKPYYNQQQIWQKIPTAET